MKKKRVLISIIIFILTYQIFIPSLSANGVTADIEIIEPKIQTELEDNAGSENQTGLQTQT